MVSLHYNACLVLKGPISGKQKKKKNQGFGLKFLRNQRYYQTLTILDTKYA